MNKYRIYYIDRYSHQSEYMDISGNSEDDVLTAIDGLFTGMEIMTIEKI